MKPDDEPTDARGTPLKESDADVPNPFAKNDATRVVDPALIKEARKHFAPPPPMPTTTEPQMPAIVMPAITQPSMPAVVLPGTGGPVPQMPMPTTTQPSIPALGDDELFEYEKLSRRTGEYQAVHRTHPAAIAVIVVVSLLAVLLAVNWLTEENLDGTPGDPPGVRVQKLFSW